MMGQTEPYEEVPWFWSDQYEHQLRYAGFHGGWDDLVLREGEGALAAYYVKGGALQAAVSLDLDLVVRRAMPFIAAQASIESLRLG